jgi:hypothetical protein
LENHKKQQKPKMQHSQRWKNPPYLLAHWQAPRAMLKPKLAKELTNASPGTAFKGGLRFPTHKKQNKFVLRIKVSAVR